MLPSIAKSGNYGLAEYNGTRKEARMDKDRDQGLEMVWKKEDPIDEATIGNIRER